MKSFCLRMALVAGIVLMVAGCDALQGVEPQLDGSWKPVYANFTYDDAVYTVHYDGPLDQLGKAEAVRQGKTNPDVIYSTEIVFSGLQFSRHGDTRVVAYISFEDSPLLKLGQFLRYKVEGNMIYFEIPKSYFVNGADDDPVWSEAQAFKFIDPDNLVIGDVTYVRM